MSRVKNFMLRLSHSAGRYTRDAITLLTGSLLFSLSVNVFLLPGKIVLGGFTGISTLLNIVFGFHVGATIFILNVPFALVNTRYYGFRFLFKSFAGVFTTSVFTELLSGIGSMSADPLVCSVLGGISMGAACGIMFFRGYTTGGTDLIAWLMRYHMPRVSIGTLIFFSDAAVIIFAAAVLRDFSGFLWSMLTIAVCSKTLDYTGDFLRRIKKRVKKTVAEE